MVALVPRGWLPCECNRSNVISWVTPPDSFMASPQFACRIFFSPKKSLLVLLLPLFPEMLCLSAPIDCGKTELSFGLVSLCFSLKPIPGISGSASAWYVCSALPEVFVSLLIRPLMCLQRAQMQTQKFLS